MGGHTDSEVASEGVSYVARKDVWKDRGARIMYLPVQ